MDRGLKIVSETLNKHLDPQLSLALKNRQKSPKKSLSVCGVYVCMSQCRHVFGNVAFIALWCLQKCCLKWQRFLMDLANVQTHTLLYTHIHPAANTQPRYVVHFCGELHFAYQLPLSFKKLLFSLFEYANFISIVIQSHLVSTSSNCCQISVSLLLSVCRPKTETSESYRIPLTRFSVWLSRACCNICSSWGLYVFTGITQPAQTLPYERGTHTHPLAHTQRATSY